MRIRFGRVPYIFYRGIGRQSSSPLVTHEGAVVVYRGHDAGRMAWIALQFVAKMKRLVNDDPIPSFEGVARLLQARRRLVLFGAFPVGLRALIHPIEEAHFTAPIPARARGLEQELPAAAQAHPAERCLFPQFRLSGVRLPPPPISHRRAGFQWIWIPELAVVALVQQAVAALHYGS
jgi:hypothetical protein